MATWTLDSGKAPDALRQDLTRAQDRLALAIDDLAASPLASPKVIEDVTFTGAVSVNVYHKLPWRITGWLVIDKSTNADVWNTTAATNDRRDYITLTSSAATVISILVF